MLVPPTPKVAAILATVVGTHAAAARTTRAHEVIECLRSIQANTYAPLEIIIVDQSPDDSIAAALRPLLQDDVRLRYIHTHIAGKTRAQNLAITTSDADLFAFTDDDCVVSHDWVGSIVEVFQRHPDVGLLFGEVRPPAGHDWATSFVPELHVTREERLRPRLLPRATSLLGANMAVRRQTFAHIGLFDETLGPGGTCVEACEEIDFYLRALRAYPPVGICLTPAFPVVHKYGSRPQGEAARQLLRTYERGKTAIMARHARRGDVGAACKLALLAFEPFAEAAVNLLRTGKPRGAGMIVPYVEGIIRGLPAARRSGGRPLSAQEQEP
jgi:GT2 family glycosyltransferase